MLGCPGKPQGSHSHGESWTPGSPGALRTLRALRSGCGGLSALGAARGEEVWWQEDGVRGECLGAHALSIGTEMERKPG